MSSLYQNLLNVGQLAGIGYDLCFKYKTCIISYEQERLIAIEHNIRTIAKKSSITIKN
jgi:hypothetical protein